MPVAVDALAAGLATLLAAVILTLLAALLVLLAIHRAGPLLFLPITLTAALFALLALLVLPLPLQILLAQLVLLPVGIRIFAHLAMLIAVVAALAILAHGIFSWKYVPETGLEENGRGGANVPVVSG